jgi:hypothetical protein
MDNKAATTTPPKEKKSKKQVRQTVYEKLAAALADYKAQLKGKKFENNLRKASKLFAADISKASRLNGTKKKDKTKKESA